MFDSLRMVMTDFDIFFEMMPGTKSKVPEEPIKPMQVEPYTYRSQYRLNMIFTLASADVGGIFITKNSKRIN